MVLRSARSELMAAPRPLYRRTLPSNMKRYANEVCYSSQSELPFAESVAQDSFGRQGQRLELGQLLVP